MDTKGLARNDKVKGEGTGSSLCGGDFIVQHACMILLLAPTIGPRTAKTCSEPKLGFWRASHHLQVCMQPRRRSRIETPVARFWTSSLVYCSSLSSLSSLSKPFQGKEYFVTEDDELPNSYLSHHRSVNDSAAEAGKTTMCINRSDMVYCAR